MVFKIFCKKIFFSHNKKISIFITLFILDVFINERTQNILCSQLWGHYFKGILFLSEDIFPLRFP